MGLFERLAGLHGYGGVDACRRGFTLEVCGEEIALEDGHGVVDPAVFLGGVEPEMMVRIDAHWGLV